MPHGERRQLTLLFCDLVGSTPLSQQLDAEEWHDLIAQYQQAAAVAVARFGGHVAKSLGDGLLIYFGWPTAREDDPERAVRAGLAIVDAMALLNEALADGGGMRLAVRIGLHTGPVVIAYGGEVFGDTANVAARVQGAAEPDTVVITAATQRLVAGIFVVEDRGPQELKGVREPVTLYRVVQPSGVRSRLDVAAGRLTRLVGRDVELATLIERWERAQGGEGQAVVVLGDAGVGKSRLVYELRERLVAVPHTWLECGATPYTEGTPFHPVITLVAQGLGFAPEDTGAEKLAKIEHRLGGLGTAETVALLADLVGLPLPKGLQLSPELQRRKTIELLAQWTLAISAVQPLVLLVEDLQWCDPSSLELLGHLVVQSPTMQVLLLATARAEFTPAWPAAENATMLHLPRLTDRQTRSMVMALAGEMLPRETLDVLVARADGVPLYVEELTRSIVETGTARSAEAIPATLAASLMGRLDRLSAAKEVAQRAAVLGREFSYRLLAAVAGLEEVTLRHGLTRLVEGEIVFARGEPPDATYVFKHALVQEAAYASLLKRTRQQLHGRIVDALATEFAPGAAAAPEVMARHAEAAGRIDDAILQYERAGAVAQDRSAHAEAIAHFRRAIGLLATRASHAERDTREVALQLACGASLCVTYGYAHPETEAAYERAGILAEGAGDARLGLARAGLALFYFTRGEVERGRALLARVLAAAEARGDVDQMIFGHGVSIPEYWQGKFVSSLAHCERLVALYDPDRHHTLVRVIGTDQAVLALGMAAWNLWHLGRPDAAVVRAREAVDLARRLNHTFSVANALVWEAWVHWFRRDSSRQRERAAEAIALSETCGFPFCLGLARWIHGAGGVAQGDTAAFDEMLGGLALASQTGNQGGAPCFPGLLAEAQLNAGQIAEAQESLAAAHTLAAHTGQPFWDVELHRLDGELLLATGSTREEAAAHYEEGLAIARLQGARGFGLRAAMGLARLRRDQGRRAEGWALLASAYGTFTEGFDTRDLKDAQALLAGLQEAIVPRHST